MILPGPIVSKDVVFDSLEWIVDIVVDIDDNDVNEVT